MADGFISGQEATKKLQTYENLVGANQVHSEAVTLTNADGTPLTTLPVAVSAPVATTGAYDERYSGGKTAFATTINASGDSILVTPTTGKSVRLVWVSVIPSSDNSSANRVRIKFGPGGTPMYECYAVSHWEVFTGGLNVPLYINAQTSEPVSVTVHYREV